MAYHDDSDADDEFERSLMTSPGRAHTDSEGSSPPPSAGLTPTLFEPAEDGTIPDSSITEWTPEECAQFVASLNLRQYCDVFIEHGIVGEALIALKHEELKEMGITSIGHRLTLLKTVYEEKIRQDVPIEPDDYIPPSAEQNPQYEMATKDDINRLTKAILQLRDDRIVQAEAQLTKLADDYRKLRTELLPVFKIAKETSQPLPYRPSEVSPDYQEPMISPPLQTAVPVPEKTSLTRSFSKKLGFSSSTPKTNSPTYIPNIIHEARAHNDSSSLLPSAAANMASNSLTAAMSGGSAPQRSPNLPSPTSPEPYHQPLAPRSYQRETPNNVFRYDGIEDNAIRRDPNPTPPLFHEPLKSASLGKSSLNINSYSSQTSTIVPPREMSASVPPHVGSGGGGGGSRSVSAGIGQTEKEDPSVQIFKSFRVALDDPCYKVLPAALRKYNIQADWRQYALYIVYGDQERCVGMDEKPLALFKDLDKEGKKPMFMLRKIANGGTPPTAGLKQGFPGGGGGGGGLASSSASIRTMQPGSALPGGVL